VAPPGSRDGTRVPRGSLSSLRALRFSKAFGTPGISPRQSSSSTAQILYGGLTDLLKPGEYWAFSDLLTQIEKELPVSAVRFYATYMRVDPAKSAEHQLLTQAQKPSSTAPRRRRM